MSKELPLKIGFTLTVNELYDPLERSNFWDSPSTIEWFRDRGYTLYQRYIEDGEATSGTTPVSVTENLLEDTYPYSYHDNVRYSGEIAKLYVEEHSGKVIFAQDSQQRHVAIKLVRAGSDEERILRFLSQQSLDTLKENCMLPVLEFLPAEGFWLVVMPRWGHAIHLPGESTSRGVLQIMRSLLKALNFLHQHNIIHRDIRFPNVLVNHFADSGSLAYNSVRYEMQSAGTLSYSLIDFDISVMVPSEMDRRKYRLPYHLSFWGSFNQPNDTRQGEFDYDPFAFDVGCLGVDFCHFYQTYAKDLPLLAPLLDRMTTRDIPNRFTAAEALQFLEERCSELPESTLDVIISNPKRSGRRYDVYDRWEHVPPEFAAKWAAFKEPYIPWTTRFLRYIVAREWLPGYIIPNIRWFFFQISSSPYHFLTHFVGLGAIRKLGMASR